METASKPGREDLRRGSTLWVLVAALIFAGVGGAAVWSGWTHSDDPAGGPPSISVRDVIRSQGGALGSVPS